MEMSLADWVMASVGILGTISIVGIVGFAFREVMRACAVACGEESSIPRAGQAAAASLLPLAVDHATYGDCLDGGWSGGFSGEGFDGGGD